MYRDDARRMHAQVEESTGTTFYFTFTSTQRVQLRIAQTLIKSNFYYLLSFAIITTPLTGYTVNNLVALVESNQTIHKLRFDPE